MRYSTSGRDFSYWLFKDRTPVTKSIIRRECRHISCGGDFRDEGCTSVPQFSSSTLFLAPWTALTYPLVSLDPIGLLFSCWWLWWAGGSLERSWGSQRFGIFFFANAAITAVGLYLGALLFHVGSLNLVGLWMPLAGVTIAYAMTNPEQQIMFYFVIPIEDEVPGAVRCHLRALQLQVPARYSSRSPDVRSRTCIFAGRASVHHAPIDLTMRTFESIFLTAGPRYSNPTRWYRDYQERKRLKKFLGKSNFPDL